VVLLTPAYLSILHPLWKSEKHIHTYAIVILFFLLYAIPWIHGLNGHGSMGLAGRIILIGPRPCMHGQGHACMADVWSVPEGEDSSCARPSLISSFSSPFRHYWHAAVILHFLFLLNFYYFKLFRPLNILLLLLLLFCHISLPLPLISSPCLFLHPPPLASR